MTCLNTGLNRFHTHTFLGNVKRHAYLLLYWPLSLQSQPEIEYWVYSWGRILACTGSVKNGPAVVVGVVQQQHNGWSWSLISCWTLSGDGSGCSSWRSSGGGSCGCGCGGSCGGGGISRSSFQYHFSTSVLRLAFLDMMDCVGFGRVVYEGRRGSCEWDQEIKQARIYNSTELDFI